MLSTSNCKLKMHHFNFTYFDLIIVKLCQFCSDGALLVLAYVMVGYKCQGTVLL